MRVYLFELISENKMINILVLDYINCFFNFNVLITMD